jgi:hypothetical protein
MKVETRRVNDAADPTPADRPGRGTPAGAATEEQLAGGMGSGGAVVRVGDTVRRPIRPHTAAVDAFLRHLERAGFSGAPRVLGTDELGREVLSYIEGNVGLPPFPAWVGDERLLRSVARLQRALHDASRSFEAPADAVWGRSGGPETSSDAIVCHNDLCVENVVVRDGEAVAFIDFDFAAPSDPLLDIAIAARHWVPIRDPIDVDPELRGLDSIGRFRIFCDEHALERSRRTAVVAHAAAFLDWALQAMRLRAESGLEAYRRVWASGYPEQNRRSRAWVDRNADALAR